MQLTGKNLYPPNFKGAQQWVKSGNFLLDIWRSQNQSYSWETKSNLNIFVLWGFLSRILSIYEKGIALHVHLGIILH